jgi:hypothetical protein
MRRIVLAAAMAAALLSPTLVEAHGGRGGGHSTGHGFAVLRGTAGGHSARHSFAVRGIASGHSAPPKAWTAAPALVEMAAPGLAEVAAQSPRSVSASYCTTCVRESNGRIAPIPFRIPGAREK